MKAKLLCGALLLAAAAALHGQSGGVDADQQKALLAEVRKLRVELLEMRIEAQAAKIPALEQGLAQIETRRARLAEEERSAPQQLANLDSRFRGQTLPPEQRAEFEGVKAAFLAAQAEHSNTERSTLQMREAEISASLKLEEQRLQALKALLNELTAAK